MNAAAASFAALTLLASVATAQTPEQPAHVAKPDIRPFSSQSLSFEEGPARPDAGAQFVSRGPRHTLTLKPGDAGLTLRQPAGSRDRTLRMTLTGANQAPHLTGTELLPGRIYHATANSLGTLTGAASYRGVKYASVYPGIDLVYYGNDRQLEFDFLVAPHKDANQIRLSFAGADTMTLEPGGELSFRIGADEVRLKKPSVYQERAGVREPVAGGYRLVNRRLHEVRFQLGEYDESRPLVIDPTIVFATYRGGTADDFPRQIKVNALGETYLFADSQDPSSLPLNHPNQSVPLAPPQVALSQCFLTKISNDGTTALYTVIFEGAGCQAMDLAPEGASPEPKVHVHVGTSFHYQRTLTENAGGGLTLEPLQGAYDVCQFGACGPVQWMRADSNGNVYFVMFYTPGSATPPDFVYELRKIDSHGQLVGAMPLIRPPNYHTSFGNSLQDQITGLDVDDLGNAYVIGYGATAGIITPTTNAFQSARPSGNVCNDPLFTTCYDGFVLRVATAAPGAFEVTYASYLGGSGDDRPFGVALDSTTAGIYVTGVSNSSNFRTTPGSYFPAPPSLQGVGAAFLVKLDLEQAPAQQLRFGTFLSGADATPTAIAVLPGGMPAIVGQAGDSICGAAQCFPSVNALYPPRLGNETRPFLSVFSADGATLPFSTFLDNTQGSDNFPQSVATNGSPIVYVGMVTNDASLGTPGVLQPSIDGEHDTLVQAIDVTGVVPANNPPEITFTPSTLDVTVMTPTTGAFVPLVCGRLFTCGLADSDGDFITHLVWTGPNGFRAVSSGGLPAPANQPGIIPAAFASAGVGTHVYTLVARDERGGIGTATLTVNVGGENTNEGTAQHVVPTDARFVADNYRPLGSEHPIEVTFPNVTSSGLTWLESRSDLMPPPPPGLQAGSPPYYYDIQSNAGFIGTLNLCFNIRGMSFARPQDQLSIYQASGDAWTPLVNQSRPTSDQVCGDTASLGTFAVFYPEVPETRITTFAGTGCAEDAVDGFGGDPCDDFREFASATDSSLTRPGSLAASVSGQPYIYVADNGSTLGTRIRRIDVVNSVVSTAVPAGICYAFGPMAVDESANALYCTQWDTSTGLRSIIRYDLTANTPTTVLASWLGDISALAVDSQGNLFFADGIIYRVAAAGGPPLQILGVNSQPGVHHLSYYDRFITLAFDRQRSLLAGGSTLVRISPGADQIVDGSPDETVTTVGGIPGANLVGYAEPFGGDGLPALQAWLPFTYQMAVTADGAVVFTDESTRIRRIDPGADGIVNGGAGEIVRTIAGYFSSTLADPGVFATSEHGDFRGIVEDPLSPGSFIVASQQNHKLQRFGISTGAEVEPSADLAVSVAAPANGATVGVGMPLTFDVVISNLGPSAAFTSRLTFPLPAAATFVSATIPGGICESASGVVVCDVDNLAPGASLRASIVVTPAVAGAIAAIFAASSPVLDPVSSNNAATVNVSADTQPVMISVIEQIAVSDTAGVMKSAMITVTESITVTDDTQPLTADLAIAVSAAPATVGAGGTVHYTVTVSNNGPGLASGLGIGMPIPGGVSVATIDSPGGLCTFPIFGLPGTLNCSVLAPLAPGTQYVMSVDLTPTAVGTLSNTFTVSSATADPDAANNVATATVTVTPATDISIAVVPSRTLLNVGDALSYAVTVTNGGPLAATAVSFSMPAPAGFAIDQINLPPLACIYQIFLGSVSCGLGDLGPGAHVQFSVDGHVTAGPTATATFNAGAAEDDPTPANNTATIVVIANRPPVVDAGPDREIVVTTSPAGIALTAIASDPDGDSLTVSWFEGSTFLANGSPGEATLPYGSHTISAVVTDRRGAQGTDTVVIVVRPAALHPPAFLSLDANAPGQAALSWPTVPGAAEYRIFRDVDPVTVFQVSPPGDVLTSNAHLVGTVAGTSFVDTGLPPLVRQFYTVVAVNGSVVSKPLPGGQLFVQAEPDAPIFGFADTHSHQFANLGFGRSLIWGAPFSPAGIADALDRCEEAHGPNGILDVAGNFLTKSVGHNTLGFDPSSHSEFTGWPRWDTRTHQQMYYTSVRRAFDGGQRLMVMHAESNKLLCQITPHSPLFSCDDMSSVEDQLLGAKALQDSIDNEAGGAGKGWYRIAYSGTEARHIINSGRMAVVLGIEVDELFDCGRNATCTLDDIRTKLDHYHQLGVRHLFPIGHFDNAFGGAAMYNPLFNFGNYATTGSFFQARECGNEGYRYTANSGGEAAAWNALQAILHPFVPLPTIPNPPFVSDCNSRDLTGLGAFLVREMMARGMIIDIDHMSELAANDVLTIAEENGYPGVASGHSGPLSAADGQKATEGAKTSSQLNRIHDLGGLSGVILSQGERSTLNHPDGIGQHAGATVLNDCGQSSKTFAQAYLAAVDAIGGPATAAVAIGSDFNGLGGQPGPRFGARACEGDSEHAGQSNPVAYPFSIVAPAGVASAGHLAMSTQPLRIDNDATTPWDFNVDGLAHAGMVPDLIEDLRRVGVTPAYLQPLFRSAEAYVRMWERAEASTTPFQGGTLMHPGADVQHKASSSDGSGQPVLASFASINQDGYLVAERIENPPPPPAGAIFIGPVFDIITTALYTAPITVCIDGTSFTSADRLVHFESAAWLDITLAGQNTATRICGQSSSLSPFAVVRSVAMNQPPTASAGTYPPFEATSPAGAAVALSGSGSDPDPGDALTFRWAEESVTLGSAAAITPTLALGTHNLTLAVSDSHGATAVSTTSVVVRDTRPPTVTPPVALSIPAAESTGTRVGSWPALSAWLASATATDIGDPAPVRLAAQVNGAPVDATTLFRTGATTVKFLFKDASGNTGFATSTVTVSVGAPRLKLALVGSGTIQGRDKFVDLSVTNEGSGIARRATMIVMALTTKGSGFPKVRRPMPVPAGDLNPGETRIVRVQITVPSSAKELLLIEAGAFLNVKGQPGVFADLQAYKP